MLSHVWLFVITWTVPHQSPLSFGNLPGKNAEVGCHFLLQRIFPTQGSNLYLLHLLHWQVYSLPYVTRKAPIKERRNMSIAWGNRLDAQLATWMGLKKESYYWKKYNIYSKTNCTEITTKICAQDKKSPFARIHYYWCTEQSFGLCGRGRGWDDLGEWHWNMYNIWNESPVQVWCTILDAWGWSTGTTQRDGTGREEGSGWGTHVFLWWIHVDIWQKQYNIVKLKKKKKIIGEHKPC